MLVEWKGQLEACVVVVVEEMVFDFLVLILICSCIYIYLDKIIN